MHYQSALAEEIRASAARLLAEDVGPGDITAQLIPEHQWATADLITRESAVLCGAAWVDEIFRRLDSRQASIGMPPTAISLRLGSVF